MKNKILKSLFYLGLVFLFFSKSIFSYAQLDPKDPNVYHSNCLQNYTIGFFNGVWNTRIDARNSLKKLKSINKVFYNDTGSNHNASSLEDIAETFIQRADEIDATGNLG